MSTKKALIKPRIFISSNGQLAEPQYFQDFKKHLKAHNIRVIEYKRFRGKAPWKFIEAALKYKQELETEGDFFEKDGDQFWCVLDVDNFWADNQADFRSGLVLAKRNSIHIAWSNECFELWFLCHFASSSTALPRRDYHKKLTKHFKDNGLGDYKKNMNQIFAPLQSLQEDAVKNAKKLFAPGKIEKNPSTAVFQLAEAIIQSSK